MPPKLEVSSQFQGKWSVSKVPASKEEAPGSEPPGQQGSPQFKLEDIPTIILSEDDLLDLESPSTSTLRSA